MLPEGARRCRMCGLFRAWLKPVCSFSKSHPPEPQQPRRCFCGSALAPLIQRRRCALMCLIEVTKTQSDSPCQTWNTDINSVSVLSFFQVICSGYACSQQMLASLSTACPCRYSCKHCCILMSISPPMHTPRQHGMSFICMHAITVPAAYEPARMHVYTHAVDADRQ